MRACLWVVLLCAATATALADEPERPWARGVPKERQQQALELFRDGNVKLRDALFKAARDRYVEALAVWDHPAIHYNLSLSLMNLEQPVEAYEHLLLALKYGAAPLDAEKMDQALRYKSLVEHQLTKLTVTCELAGATVRVDGNPLTLDAGRWHGMVRAGRHSIVATKDGYVPAEVAETFVGGEAKDVVLTLFRTEELTEYRRLWPVAFPWAVLAAGAVVAGTGAGLHAASRGEFDAYDRGVSACATPAAAGCVPSTELAQRRLSGQGLQAVAVTSYVVGGAALAAGAVLLYLNRPLPYVRTVEVPKVTLAPILAPGSVGATAVVSF